MAQERANCARIIAKQRPLGRSKLYLITAPVPQGRNNQEPGTEVPGTLSLCHGSRTSELRANHKKQRPLGRSKLYFTTAPVPQGRNNKEPGTEVPGTPGKAIESR
jgi:hypothetical protein